MERSDLIEVAKRMIHYAETGTTASHDEGPRRNPIATYTDPEQFEYEKERIFERYPQLVCLSRDLPNPGDYLTRDDMRKPIVVVRNRDGQVRAFLNSCSHRSARLVEGQGKLRGGFVCPYHAWAFDLNGRCTGIHKEETFGEVNRSEYGLVELPCEEKYGFVYVAPRPDAHFTVDEHLGDLGPQLGSWDLGQATLIDSHEWNLDTNWKLALDTFCEGYHFWPLHSKTVGTFAMTNCSTYDRYGKHGEHHRLGFPSKTILDLRGLPEDEWDPMEHFSFVHYLFPNISLLVSPDEVELFQLFPGDRVDQHITRYNLYMRKPMDSDERWEAARQHFGFIRDVVDQEDYWVSANVQRNFRTGMREYTTFGRNEPSLINMHRTFRHMAGLPLVDEPVPQGEAE
ncbi:MAG: aromatic ring-hydroxylating dioxygenase subunit alpha [Proteobacteria bacterium]|nr:aromatic ring-hydroxylating dioxygenase subunit alpha [Pseudomonadota bacterium]